MNAAFWISARRQGESVVEVARVRNQLSDIESGQRVINGGRARHGRVDRAIGRGAGRASSRANTHGSVDARRFGRIEQRRIEKALRTAAVINRLIPGETNPQIERQAAMD